MKLLILAGGTGRRLWPVSRTYYPKQFVKLRNINKSAFQTTLEAMSQFMKTKDIYVVTNVEYKYHVLGQIAELGFQMDESNIILEPSFKNTLHAVTSGVYSIVKSSERSQKIIVMPTNNNIRITKELLFSLRPAIKMADETIVTFGVKTENFNTSYGYIKKGEKYYDGYLIDKFIEKPSIDNADDIIKDQYYINSGALLFSAAVYINELKKVEKNLIEAYESSDVAKAYEIRNTSTIEKALLERTKSLSVMPIDAKWKRSDFNEFSSFYSSYKDDKDSDGNISFNEDIFINSENNLVYTEKSKAVGIIGVSDLVIISQPDALLICRKDMADKVSEVATQLKIKGDERADYHTTQYRPWGSFTILEDGLGYKIKRISVQPGKKLSYQLHYQRSEHWVVANGVGKVTIEGTEKLVKQGESIFISLGNKHRLENPGKTMLELIEVQIGDYLGEDDIVRFDDDFGR